MKTALITLLLLPFLSFGQVSEQDKEAIDNYAISMCDCISQLFDELHPKTIDVILLIAEEGQDEAMMDLETMLEEMSPEETEEFLASFEAMESEAFAQRIENCEDATDLETELEDQINNEAGAAFTYFMEVFSQEERCKVMKVLYDLGDAGEE